MTQPINADDVLEMTIEGVNEGVPWALVRHCLVTACADTDALLTMLHTWIEGSLCVSLASVSTDKWAAQCATIGRVAPAPMNLSFNNFTAEVVGDITTDGVPNQAAVLARLLSSELGPRNRGRAYLCGCPEADTNAGRLTVTGLGLWQTAANEIKAAQDDGNGNMVSQCVFSRTQYAVNPAAAVTAYTAVIDTVQVQANLAVVRRRRYPRSVPG